jgi:hypothetical protein
MEPDETVDYDDRFRITALDPLQNDRAAGSWRILASPNTKKLSSVLIRSRWNRSITAIEGFSASSARTAACSFAYLVSSQGDRIGKRRREGALSGTGLARQQETVAHDQVFNHPPNFGDIFNAR